MYVKNLNEWITSYETHKVSETKTYDYLELNDNQIVIAENMASWSWDDSGGQNTLYVILDKDTGNLDLKVRRYDRDDLFHKNSDTINIRGRFGTISKPNLSGINKVMQEYNFENKFGKKMKRNTWDSNIISKWESKLIDILKSPELQKILNMSLIENFSIGKSNNEDSNIIDE